MGAATQSVGYSMGLQVIITYIFGIALTNLSAEYTAEYVEEHGLEQAPIHTQYFESVSLSMYSLIIYATFLDDLAAFGDPIKEQNTLCLILVTIFIVMASMTVMNMLIG